MQVRVNVSVFIISLRGLCSSVPLTVFDLGFAEVLVGLNSIMSVCSCSVSMPYQEDRLFFSTTFVAWPVKEECL